MSQIPRPGLWEFLARCRALVPRVVAYTSVRPTIAREVFERLVADRLAPPWLATVEIVHTATGTKDLAVLGALEGVLLVDDMREAVHPGQEAQWIPVPPLDPRRAEDDGALARVADRMAERVTGTSP